MSEFRARRLRNVIPENGPIFPEAKINPYGVSGSTLRRYKRQGLVYVDGFGQYRLTEAGAHQLGWYELSAGYVGKRRVVKPETPKNPGLIRRFLRWCQLPA